MVGARGFTADYALIVTWERMAYGGAPKVIQMDLAEQAKRWVRHKNNHSTLDCEVAILLIVFSKILTKW